MLNDFLLNKKHKLRLELKKLRNSLDETLRNRASESICEQCYAYVNQYSTIGLYYPIHSEVNILSLVAKLRDAGVTIALPVVIAGNMEFKVWPPRQELVQGRFSPEPHSANRVIVPELIIVPLLGFDNKGNRLGYGKGYYDRYFQQNPVIKVGLGFAAQEVEKIPVENYDQSLDLVITEKGIKLYN